MTSVTKDMCIYEGRAIAAPMVRVSCLSYRVLCNKHRADGCFTEELVSLKLKKSIREVVTYPVPLTCLPLGYRILASDVEKGIRGEAIECLEEDDVIPTNERTCASTTLTSVYLYPAGEEEEEEAGDDDNAANAGFFMDDSDDKKKSDEGEENENNLGDTTCRAYDLIPSILCPATADSNEEDVSSTGAGGKKNVKKAEVPQPSEEAQQALIGAFRAAFGLAPSSATATVTIAAEALVAFVRHYNTTMTANNNASAFRFLDPSNIIAHIKAVEFVQYEPFKKGFRRAAAASFLPKSIVNPFPEGDRRPECERWGSVHFASSSASAPSSPAPEIAARHNDIRCAQVICQLGAANPTDASEASAVIAKEVDGIDVNMGCPKAFSIQNGMGAALMRIPVMAGTILRSIHTSVNNREALAGRRGEWLENAKALAAMDGGASTTMTTPTPSAAVDSNNNNKGMVIPISFKTRIFGTTEESIKHLATVVASCIRPHAEKRTRCEEDDGSENDGNGKKADIDASNATAASSSSPSTAVDFPCPLHAISLHARTRPQRSETEPLADQAQAIMQAMRTVTGAMITPTVPLPPAEVIVMPDGKKKRPPQPPVDDEGEDFTPIMAGEAEGKEKNSATTVIPLTEQIKAMTFIFNGSVAANPKTTIPCPTFSGALLGRSAMWDATVFNNHAFIPEHTFGTAQAVSGEGNVSPTFALPNASPIPSSVDRPHIPFSELLAWAPPCNFGLPSEWLSMRKRITDEERYSLQQLGRVFVEVIRHFAAFKKNTMYLKYYFTRTFSEFPVGKLTYRELEFLFMRDEDMIVPADCADVNDPAAVAAAKEKVLEQIAEEMSKINKKQRGEEIAFVSVQSANSWPDFYVMLQRFANCNWGALKGVRHQNVAPSTYVPSIMKAAVAPTFDYETKAIRASMSHSDQFIFAVMQRGDEVIPEIPKTAFLRKHVDGSK